MRKLNCGLSIVFVLCGVFSIKAQNYFECGTVEPKTDDYVLKSLSCGGTSSDFTNHYRNKETYIPSTGSKEDFIKTIHVSFHIWQKADGTGNIDDNPTNRARLRQIIDWVNGNYAINAPNLTPVPYATQNITDTRFRIVLDSIYFYRDVSPGLTYYYCNGVYTHNMKLDNYLEANHPERTKSLPLHLSAGYYASASGYSHHGSILSFYRTSPEMNTNDDHDWWYAQHIAHEIGHGLDLWHTYDRNDAYLQNCKTNYQDFLWDVYDITATQPCASMLSCDVCVIPVGSSNNNLMGGGESNFKSALQMGIMHRSVILENQRNLDYEMRNYVTGYNTTPFQITSNQTWDFSMKMYQDLVIKPGVTLTVKCELQFVPEARVIIEPGGKLIVDGGKLTNERYYDTFWRGVEVWGTTSQHQYPESQPTYQGRLDLVNGGTIENAYNGARNWKPEDFGKAGGVIVSNGGVFKNNRRAVEFISYENFSNTNPSIKRDNTSSFTNTDFIWDDDFIGGANYDALVTMWNVYGINFTNCHFSNDMTQIRSTIDPSQNIAIQSIDAGYRILAGCNVFIFPCPSGNLTKSSFSGFLNAISATGAGTTKTVTISQSTFDDNLRGISIDDFDNIFINRNTINIGVANYFLPTSGFGIKILNSTGYSVEENTIAAPLFGRTSYGIQVNNSGTDNNRLYKNTLNGLSYGQHLAGINRNASDAYKGLQFLCNTFNNNNRAVYVGTATSTHGVRLYQGDPSPLKSAGNIFNNNTTNSIQNVSTWPISYYHSGGTTTPTSNTTNVTLYNTTNANSCPSSFGGLIWGLGLQAVDSLSARAQVLQESYNALYDTYTSLIDEGNTMRLKEQITQNGSNEGWQLRETLLEKSPYLSEEIILDAAKQGVLTDAMLLEICLANPDATKGAYFEQKLTDATGGLFPLEMYDHIRTNWEKTTTRTKLESQLGALQAEISVTKNFLTHIKSSAEAYTYAERHELVSKGRELSGKIQQMDFFIENSQYGKADSVLWSIHDDRKIQESIELISDFDVYIAFRSGLGDRNLAQLNSSEITLLKTLAEKDGRVAGYAQNILCFFYQICYDRNTLMEESELPSDSHVQPQVNQAALDRLSCKVNIYPNPAEDQVQLQWEITEKLQDCHYKIHDLTGMLVAEGAILQNNGEKTINLTDFTNGAYIITIRNADQMKTAVKLLVNHGK